jgi:stage V sporulation protein G
MEITDIRVTLRNEDNLKAFVNITFDNQFVIRGLKVINGKSGYFVSMPSRKRPDGTHQDIAHPVNNDARRFIEEQVLLAYQKELESADLSTSAL